MIAAMEKLVILQFPDLSPLEEVTPGGGLGDGVALASLMSPRKQFYFKYFVGQKII